MPFVTSDIHLHNQVYTNSRDIRCLKSALVGIFANLVPNSQKRPKIPKNRKKQNILYICYASHSNQISCFIGIIPIRT